MVEIIKHKMLIAIVLALCIPLFFAVEAPSSWVLDAGNLKDLASYFASVLGYIGIALLTLEFVLGTRAVSGLMFKDLASKLSLHSKLGKYGIALIFLHPMLVAYSYGERFYYSILPQFGSEFEKHVTLGRFAVFGLVVIWITSAVLKSKIGYRPWKYIHYIAYPVLFLSLLHVPPIGSSFDEQYIRFFWYLIVGIVLICTALRMRHLFGFGKYPYQVVGHKQISENIWVMDLKALDGHISIKTGQYVYMQPSLVSEEHPFSVLNHSEHDATFSISYKVYGKFTEKMARTLLGDQYLVDGPYGVFTKEINVNPGKSAVFIAGGIGITPFIKHCLNDKGDRTLFYAVKSPSSAAFRNILEPLLREKLVMVIEKDQSPAKDNDERGLITKEIVSKYIDTPMKHEYYICGPEEMMKSVKRILLDLGVKKKHIHVENFSY